VDHDDARLHHTATRCCRGRYRIAHLPTFTRLCIWHPQCTISKRRKLTPIANALGGQRNERQKNSNACAQTRRRRTALDCRRVTRRCPSASPCSRPHPAACHQGRSSRGTRARLSPAAGRRATNCPRQHCRFKAFCFSSCCCPRCPPSPASSSSCPNCRPFSCYMRCNRCHTSLDGPGRPRPRPVAVPHVRLPFPASSCSCPPVTIACQCKV
jgi:hypothetical protein